MKRMFWIAVVVLWSGAAMASPFVVCDPYPNTVTQPTYFEVILDGGAAVQSPAEVVGTTVRLHHDLAAVSTGSHTLTVKACNEWGCSASVPFPFNKAVPVAPLSTGLKLSIQ